MKSLIFTISFIISNLMMAQSFEIQVVSLSPNQVGVELRATGLPIPVTTAFVTDLVFGIKWSSSCKTDLNTSTMVSNYNIKASGNKQVSGIYEYRGFYADNVPFNVPVNWTLGSWLRVLTINTTGGSGTCPFEICEVGFDAANDPDLGIDNGTNKFFTPLIVGGARNVVLPIELLTFSAKEANRTAVLNWQSINETNFNYFDVEQSNDGKSFKSIGIVKGTGRQLYTFSDKQPFNGMTYYRLKMVDNDGSSKYSVVKTIQIGNNSKIKIYPNPTAGEITVTFDSENQEGLNIQIIDLSGKVIFETKKSVEKGETVIPLDLPKMSSGIYNIIVESKSQKFTERFSYSVN
jgi:Secretion system C-terminal sorting domain